jgi:Phospholipase_D-nuclease N-terminal
VDTGLLIALVAPVLVVEVILIVAALRDLMRPERQVRGGQKWVWAVAIVFLQLIGPLLYFAAGRENE